MLVERRCVETPWRTPWDEESQATLKKMTELLSTTKAEKRKGSRCLDHWLIYNLNREMDTIEYCLEKGQQGEYTEYITDSLHELLVYTLHYTYLKMMKHRLGTVRDTASYVLRKALEKLCVICPGQYDGLLEKLEPTTRKLRSIGSLASVGNTFKKAYDQIYHKQLAILKRRIAEELEFDVIVKLNEHDYLYRDHYGEDLRIATGARMMYFEKKEQEGFATTEIVLCGRPPPPPLNVV